ncbi:MAG TPA: hypothetical protein VFJ19_18920 [Nocardioidaceae bacterium]|nr:hypothetical protein [Nocardioidaceae bacterium]
MRPRRRHGPVVPTLLVDQINAALAAVDAAQAELGDAVADKAPLLDRRTAHTRLRHAFDDADALLRQATGMAQQHSFRDWSRWRHRLSTLDAARQAHLFAEQDDMCVLSVGSVRAVDTGMSGPDIGDLQHGRSCAPGTAPGYGLDVEALLTSDRTTLDPTGCEPTEEHNQTATVVVLPVSTLGSPPEAA